MPSGVASGPVCVPHIRNAIDQPPGRHDHVEQLVAQVGVGPLQRAGPGQQVGCGEGAAVDVDGVGVEGAERGDACGVVGGRVQPDGHEPVDQTGVGDGHWSASRPDAASLRRRRPVRQQCHPPGSGCGWPRPATTSLECSGSDDRRMGDITLIYEPCVPFVAIIGPPPAGGPVGGRVGDADESAGRPRRRPSGRRRGKSGLRRAGWLSTATRGDPRDSATENRPPRASSAG